MDKKVKYKKDAKYWIIPISVVVSIWIISILGFSYYEKSEDDKLHRETEIISEQIKLRLESWVQHRIDVVENMAILSASQDSFDSSLFEQKAEELISWFPGLQALNWIDQDWTIQIVVPLEGNEPALGKDLKYHPSLSVQNALAKAEKNNKISRSAIMELLQGGAGFATYWPIHSSDGNILGYINGVLKVDKLIENCFSEPLLTKRFSIMFYENNKLIYKSGEKICEKTCVMKSVVSVLFVDKFLQMEIMPTETYMNASSAFIPSWILGITFLFSLGLGVLTRKSMLHNKGMRASEERFRTVVENAGDAFFLVSQDGKIIDVNQQACIDLQYSKEELTSMNIKEIDEKPNVDLVRDKINSEDAASITFESTHKRKDGSIIPVEIRISLIEIKDEEFFLCLSRNISESKKLQELENRNQRLKTAGEVAGQVAHDFNNLLAPLIAYPEFIHELLGDNHPAKEYVTKIEKSANQIAEINQQLLTLGRRGHYNQQVLDLNNLITQVVNDEIDISSDCCKITTDFADDLLPIKGGHSQIVRIITNLLHNSFDAISSDGIITIKTQNYYLDKNMSEYFSIPKGEYIKLSVADNGHGIPADVLPTIFDPFISTKKADNKKGSGLGLSIVESVMKDHNGYVDVNSKVGEGTVFYLYFPVCRDDIQETSSTQIVGGNEKILVVDDDEMILEVTQKILDNLGYETKTAQSGEACLEMLQNENFDLLLLDMIIPDSIDGTETYKRALEINTNQKAIIVSGYAESQRVNEAMQLGVQ